ncbi:MAG: 2-octaprenyl-6-methoxyphenyl hydroxylase [Proteobacteria bacterium]|nr:2-octaprenyl-6-methoxyphenyl hydroxylase [Pseudomonadota bacterium]
MVGGSLALALSALPLSVVVIEAVEPEDGSQPSFDSRTIALSNGTRRVFAGLGVWDEIGREATPIRRIHVSDRGHFGSAVIDAADEGVAALGYVAENRVIGRALWRRLRATPRVRLLAPARVTAAEPDAGHVRLAVETGAGPQLIAARLAVAADGAGSLVRRAAGVEAARWDYGQTAVISLVGSERFHDHVAYERFTPTGPIAALPGPDGRVVVVWTLAPAEAERVLGLADAAFLAELQACFGWRLGRLRSVGPRHAYPLALTQAAAETAARTAIIGNAAQGLHPIAGQGFNLGLRDAATLAEVLADAGAGADPGDPQLLARYAAWRHTDRRAIIAFTDGLVRLFASPFAPARLARGLGLVLFDLTPPAKSALSKLSLGFAGRLPRLARGLPLLGAGAAVPSP